jgi:hypothetical protein
MKKNTLLFCSLFLVSLCIKSQSLVVYDENMNVVSNATISIQLLPNASIATEVPVKNTSSTSKFFKVVRTYRDIDASDLTQFCWAGQCYPYTLNLAYDSIELPPNVLIDFINYIPPGELDPGWGFHAVFNAGPECVDRTVHYRFFDINNITDSTGVTIRYLCTTGISENNKVQVASEIFPNPTTNSFTLNYSVKNTNSKPTLVITDVLGNTIKQQQLINLSGSEKVDVSQLPIGIYFYSLLIEGKLQSNNKLIISQK